VIKGTPLQNNLVLVGSDGTSTMTGHTNGALRIIEELLNKPLTRSICLLHCNELPLRHVVIEIDGVTKSPDAFSGPIGSQLNGCVSDWDVTGFKEIYNPKFLEVLESYPDEVVNDLSADQHYGYRMCTAVMTGTVTPDLALLEVGPLCHARWLTLACRILRFYVSHKPTSKLTMLAEFCIKVYFPSWFEIKANKYITSGARNFFNMMQRVDQFPHTKVKTIALRYIEINAFFAHPENVLIAMLGDEDSHIRNLAVNRVMQIRGGLHDTEDDTDEFRGGDLSDQEDESYKRDVTEESRFIRKFKVPKINTKAKVYHKMVNISSPDVSEPPVISRLTDEEILNVRDHKLILKHPCHTQAVERCIKVVSDASSEVLGFPRRDGLIRQRLRSRKLVKHFDAKKDYC
jgi:hypothetical protein